MPPRLLTKPLAALFAIGLACCILPLPAQAGGRLLATGGLTEFEGSAGGGIVPWAVLSGYGTRDQFGASAFVTHVNTGDYALTAGGLAVTFANRVELSFAESSLDLGTLGPMIDQPGASLRQQVFGAKVRLWGDVVYTRAPQVSLGVQYKRDLDDDIPRAVGAKDDHGVDVYLAASKLFVGVLFGRDLLLNATVRATKANQAGLLGFGGDRHDGYQAMFEGSAGVLLDEHTVVGFEYRQKPDNLGFAHEDDWADFFIAWFPTKHIALAAAYAALGSIAGLPSQHGLYLSLQASL